MSQANVFVSQGVYVPNSGRGGAKEISASQQGGTVPRTMEYFIATGFGSRGGPNKVSNKLKRSPRSYLVF